jgi:hypothetical protein
MLVVAEGNGMFRRKRVHDDTWKSTALDHLAADSSDPALEREREHAAMAEYDTSRGFRKAFGRLLHAIFVGR